MNIASLPIALPTPPASHSAGQVELGKSNDKPAESITESKPQTREESESQLSLSKEEQTIVRELAKTDREVRAHEQAHASVGGAYAGAPSLTYQRGPDGRLYATSGEVSIDTSPVTGDPEATLEKAQVIQRAALAPAQPSDADRRIAANAAAMALQARLELSTSEQGSIINLQA